jgi:Bacterial SH3 domain
MIRHTPIAIALAVGLVALSARGQRAGVVNDPDGLVSLYAGKSTEAAVVATVKTGEPFSFEWSDDSDWYKVTLASGKFGWMQLSRIRLYFTEKDLPTNEKDPAGSSEIDEFARGRGFDYPAGTRRAARGNAKALKQFFALAQAADGAVAESIAGIPTVVYHLLGDERFAKFLVAQSLPDRMMVRNLIAHDGLMPPASMYLSRHFPQTAKALFQREMVDWFSPNGLYAIRKVFTDELELSGSKVERAELIEKKSGRVLCDLTRDDIGTGAEREGEALWSPDSKRVACLSSDLTEQRGNLFSTPRPAPLRKQTVVYQLSGEAFARVELPLIEAPERKSDKELERAILGHEYTEPIRWQKPNVLILKRHEYYETLKPMVVGDSTFESIHTLARRYQITATIDPDGKATAVWKVRKD